MTPPDAKASISGPADLYVKIGSVITLTCHIKQPSSAHDIGPIHWYRGPYILTPFVVHPNEAAIDMQRISMESKLGDKLQSRLVFLLVFGFDDVFFFVCYVILKT